MRVVADEDIGPSEYQLVGFMTLQGDGLECVFASPVERNDNNGCRVGLAQTEYTLQQ